MFSPRSRAQNPGGALPTLAEETGPGTPVFTVSTARPAKPLEGGDQGGGPIIGAVPRPLHSAPSPAQLKQEGAPALEMGVPGALETSVKKEGGAGSSEAVWSPLSGGAGLRNGMEPSAPLAVGSSPGLVLPSRPPVQPPDGAPIAPLRDPFCGAAIGMGSIPGMGMRPALGAGGPTVTVPYSPASTTQGEPPSAGAAAGSRPAAPTAPATQASTQGGQQGSPHGSAPPSRIACAAGTAELAPSPAVGASGSPPIVHPQAPAPPPGVPRPGAAQGSSPLAPAARVVASSPNHGSAALPAPGGPVRTPPRRPPPPPPPSPARVRPRPPPPPAPSSAPVVCGAALLGVAAAAPIPTLGVSSPSPQVSGAGLPSPLHAQGPTQPGAPVLSVAPSKAALSWGTALPLSGVCADALAAPVLGVHANGTHELPTPKRAHPAECEGNGEGQLLKKAKTMC